ncbi:glycosyltransferase [Arvimicrobium flavum]|uniref:glycosyltransferase n=1 Tax=Arvimicrobium flavum TaxID=3393320 RepID=UPI00237C252F|nr:glycosyltransferase [Mesorhizobium shangrilense]
MSNTPLIVMATDSMVPSGVGEHMLTLAGAISSTHEVALAFPPHGDGVRFLVRGDAAGFETVALDEAFPKWLTARRPAILHVHAGIGWEGHGLVEAGRIAGIPIVRTEHLPYLITDEQQKSQHRMAAGLADTLVVVSDSAAESYRAEGFDRLVTIRNGIDTPIVRHPRGDTRETLALPDNARLVITVARFAAQKGHDCLLHAAAEVTRQIPHVVFLMVGDGPERETMQALTASLKLANIAFLGQRADVPDLLAAADLFVLPSLFEGLPIVVLEAMALALPVVATRIGGTLEALGSDHPLLVPAGSPYSLAGAIVAALANGPGSRTVGIRGRARFEQRFTAARMGRETAALYQAMRKRVCLT